MKVLSLNYYINPTSFVGHNLLLPSVGKYSTLNEIKKDTCDISFKGNVECVDEASNYSGVHCPVCGVKMLTDKTYFGFIEKAGKVNNAEDFINLLNKYKDFIPKNMMGIFNSEEFDKPLSQIDVKEFVNMKSKEAYLNHKNHISVLKKYLLLISKNMDEQDKSVMQSMVSEIGDSESNYKFQARLFEASKILNVNPSQVYDILKNVVPYIRSSSQYFSAFNIKDKDNLSNSELAQALVKNIFAHSRMEKTPISSRKSAINYPNNEVLICSSCNSNKGKKVYWGSYGLENPNIKHNIMNYLDDMAVLMGYQKISSNKYYLTNLTYITSKISGGRVDFSKSDINGIDRMFHIASRHEEFKPIVQTDVDVPCACCGSIMLPHRIRARIDEKIKASESRKDLVQILKDNSKYIGVYSSELANLFCAIDEKYPNISDDDFLKILQEKFDEISFAKIDKAIINFEKNTDWNNKYFNPEDVSNISAKVRAYASTPKMAEFNFHDLFNSCFDALTPDVRRQTSYFVFINDLKTICFENSMVKPNKYDIETDKNPLDSVVFKLFRADVATADHIVAYNKDGENSKDNLLGLCRVCNVLKSDINLMSWLKQNNESKDNILNQLIIVNNMAKSGLIEGYNDWAKTVADKLYKGSYHTYDIRENFDN